MKVKGGINTREHAFNEFGLGALPPMQLTKDVHQLIVESLRLGRVAP